MDHRRPGTNNRSRQLPCAWQTAMWGLSAVKESFQGCSGRKSEPPQFLILKLGFSADILVYAKRVKDFYESLKTLKLFSYSLI